MKHMFRKAQHRWRTSGWCGARAPSIFLPKQQQYVVIKTFSSFNCSVNYCQNQAKNIAPYRVPGLDHCKVSYVAAKLVKTYQNKLLIVIWRHNLRHKSGPLKSTYKNKSLFNWCCPMDFNSLFKDVVMQ